MTDIDETIRRVRAPDYERSDNDLQCHEDAVMLAGECERLRERVGVLEAFARYVDEVRQPPSMSAADCCVDYETRARAALAKGGE